MTAVPTAKCIELGFEPLTKLRAAIPRCAPYKPECPDNRPSRKYITPDHLN